MSTDRAPAARAAPADIPNDEPGRWLEMDNTMAIEARIRGLDTEAECVEWIRYERDERDGGVRPGVIRALNERVQALNADGGERDGDV